MGSSTLFNEYIMELNEIKMNSEGGKKYSAKLSMNGLYGKFGTNPTRINKIPALGDNSVVSYSEKFQEETDGIYVPCATFTTAYARNVTIRSAQKVFDRFIYADTDSIHLVGTEEPTNIDIDSKKLGWWKNEGVFEDAIFLKRKTYIKLKDKPTKIENEDGEMVEILPYTIEITACGLSKGFVEANKKKGYTDINFDNFYLGRIVEGGKTMLKTVNGGKIIVEGPHSIR